jgi:hypothetical protein
MAINQNDVLPNVNDSTSVGKNTLVQLPVVSLLPSRITGPILARLTDNHLVVRCFQDDNTIERDTIPLVCACAFPKWLYFHFARQGGQSYG